MNKPYSLIQVVLNLFVRLIASQIHLELGHLYLCYYDTKRARVSADSHSPRSSGGRLEGACVLWRLFTTQSSSLVLKIAGIILFPWNY